MQTTDTQASRPENSDAAPATPVARGQRREPPPPTAGDRFRRVLPWLIAIAAALSLGLAFFSRYLVDADPIESLTIEGRIAILPFAVDAPKSDSWVDWGLATLVIETLEVTERVQVVPLRRLQETFGRRGLELHDPSGRDRARLLAAALGAELVADVTFRRDGDTALLEARFLDPQGRVIDQRRIAGNTPLEAANRLTLAIASGLAGAIAPVGFDRAFTGDAFVDRLYAEGAHTWIATSPARLPATGLAANPLAASGGSMGAAQKSSSAKRAALAKPYFEIALRSEPTFLRAKSRLIDCLRVEGKIQEARALAAQLLQETQSRGMRAIQADAFRSLGLLAAIDGDPRAAEEQYRQAHRLELARHSPLGQAEALAEQARLALAEGRLQRGQDLLIEVGQLGQKSGDVLGQIDSLIRLGSLMLSDGRLEPAETVLKEARQLAVGLLDPWEEHRALASLGEVAWRKGSLDEAIDAWQQALVFYRQQGDEARTLLLTHNLGQALLAQEAWSEAETLYNDQLEMAERSSNQRLRADAALRLAWLALRQGYPFQARDHLNIALELDRHLDDRDDLSRVIAWLAYEQGNYDLAVETLGQLQRQSGDAWTEEDDAFLSVFLRARQQGHRLPVPGDSDYGSY